MALVAAFSACSPKKNTAATRNYQAFITRYNVYFNGDEHFKETLKEMERAYEDDYSAQVLMHPVGPIQPQGPAAVRLFHPLDRKGAEGHTAPQHQEAPAPQTGPQQ